jgi:MSHA biogenesis protein MshM
VYLQHFGLTELPFSLTPDTEFVFSHHGHQAALNTALMAIEGGEGFVKITGEVGTGKTLLCRRLLRALNGERFATAYVPNPNLDSRTFYLAVAEELRLEIDSGLDDYHLLKAINKGLLDTAAKGRSVVLLIDEAQAMPGETLEAVRLLSNLETEKRKLLQIVLFGQPELDDRLRAREVRQLLQRIAFHAELGTLHKSEVELYLAHRLRVAGHRGDPVFAKRASSAMHSASRGTPRLINVLAHKALLLAYGEGRSRVGLPHVRGAARDTEGARRLPWWAV